MKTDHTFAGCRKIVLYHGKQKRGGATREDYSRSKISDIYHIVVES
jgi:hypothetical protein